MRCVVSDDSMIMRSRVENYLLQMGYTIAKSADNANAGYQACKELSPDIAIFDVLMPPGDGKERAIQTKIENPEMLVVVLTSNYQDFIKKDLEANGVKMLHKPITQGRFTNRITEWLQSTK